MYIYIYINVQIFLPNLVLLFGRPVSVLSVNGSWEGFVVKPVEFRNNISSSLSLSLSISCCFSTRIPFMFSQNLIMETLLLEKLGRKYLDI